MGIRTLILVSSLAISGQAYAQMYATSVPQVSDARSAGFLGIAKTKIDYELRSDIEVERMVIFGGMDYGLGKDTDLVFQAGFIVDSEYDDTELDGSGFMAGGGVRSRFFREGRMSASGHAFMNYLTEEFEGGYQVGAVKSDVTLEVSLLEFHVGATATFAATPAFHLFGGLELVPISDGDADLKFKSGVNTGSTDTNVERDDIMNLRLGAIIKTESIDLSPFLIFAGETTFGASVAKAF